MTSVGNATPLVCVVVLILALVVPPAAQQGGGCPPCDVPQNTVSVGVLVVSCIAVLVGTLIFEALAILCYRKYCRNREKPQKVAHRFMVSPDDELVVKENLAYESNSDIHERSLRAAKEKKRATIFSISETKDNMMYVPALFRNPISKDRDTGSAIMNGHHDYEPDFDMNNIYMYNAGWGSRVPNILSGKAHADSLEDLYIDDEYPILQTPGGVGPVNFASSKYRDGFGRKSVDIHEDDGEVTTYTYTTGFGGKVRREVATVTSEKGDDIEISGDRVTWRKGKSADDVVLEMDEEETGPETRISIDNNFTIGRPTSTRQQGNTEAEIHNESLPGTSFDPTGNFILRATPSTSRSDSSDDDLYDYGDSTERQQQALNLQKHSLPDSIGHGTFRATVGGIPLDRGSSEDETPIELFNSKYRYSTGFNKAKLVAMRAAAAAHAREDVLIEEGEQQPGDQDDKPPVFGYIKLVRPHSDPDGINEGQQYRVLPIRDSDNPDMVRLYPVGTAREPITLQNLDPGVFARDSYIRHRRETYIEVADTGVQCEMPKSRDSLGSIPSGVSQERASILRKERTSYSPDMNSMDDIPTIGVIRLMQPKSSKHVRIREDQTDMDYGTMSFSEDELTTGSLEDITYRSSSRSTDRNMTRHARRARSAPARSKHEPIMEEDSDHTFDEVPTIGVIRLVRPDSASDSSGVESEIVSSEESAPDDRSHGRKNDKWTQHEIPFVRLAQQILRESFHDRASSQQSSHQLDQNMDDIPTIGVVRLVHPKSTTREARPIPRPRMGEHFDTSEETTQRFTSSKDTPVSDMPTIGVIKLLKPDSRKKPTPWTHVSVMDKATQPENTWGQLLHEMHSIVENEIMHKTTKNQRDQPRDEVDGLARTINVIKLKRDEVSAEPRIPVSLMDCSMQSKDIEMRDEATMPTFSWSQLIHEVEDQIERRYMRMSAPAPKDNIDISRSIQKLGVIQLKAAPERIIRDSFTQTFGSNTYEKSTGPAWSFNEIREEIEEEAVRKFKRTLSRLDRPAEPQEPYEPVRSVSVIKLTKEPEHEKLVRDSVTQISGPNTYEKSSGPVQSFNEIKEEIEEEAVRKFKRTLSQLDRPAEPQEPYEPVRSVSVIKLMKQPEHEKLVRDSVTQISGPNTYEKSSGPVWSFNEIKEEIEEEAVRKFKRTLSQLDRPAEPQEPYEPVRSVSVIKLMKQPEHEKLVRDSVTQISGPNTYEKSAGPSWSFNEIKEEIEEEAVRKFKRTLSQLDRPAEPQEPYEAVRSVSVIKLTKEPQHEKLVRDSVTQISGPNTYEKSSGPVRSFNEIKEEIEEEAVRKFKRTLSQLDRLGEPQEPYEPVSSVSVIKLKKGPEAVKPAVTSRGVQPDLLWRELKEEIEDEAIEEYKKQMRRFQPREAVEQVTATTAPTVSIIKLKGPKTMPAPEKWDNITQCDLTEPKPAMADQVTEPDRPWSDVLHNVRRILENEYRRTINELETRLTYLPKDEPAVPTFAVVKLKGPDVKPEPEKPAMVHEKMQAAPHMSEQETAPERPWKNVLYDVRQILENEYRRTIRELEDQLTGKDEPDIGKTMAVFKLSAPEVPKVQTISMYTQSDVPLTGEQGTIPDRPWASVLQDVRNSVENEYRFTIRDLESQLAERPKDEPKGPTRLGFFKLKGPKQIKVKKPVIRDSFTQSEMQRNANKATQPSKPWWSLINEIEENIERRLSKEKMKPEVEPEIVQQTQQIVEMAPQQLMPSTADVMTQSSNPESVSRASQSASIERFSMSIEANIQPHVTERSTSCDILKPGVDEFVQVEPTTAMKYTLTDGTMSADFFQVFKPEFSSQETQAVPSKTTTATEALKTTPLEVSIQAHPTTSDLEMLTDPVLLSDFGTQVNLQPVPEMPVITPTIMQPVHAPVTFKEPETEKVDFAIQVLPEMINRASATEQRTFVNNFVQVGVPEPNQVEFGVQVKPEVSDSHSSIVVQMKDVGTDDKLQVMSSDKSTEMVIVKELLDIAIQVKPEVKNTVAATDKMKYSDGFSQADAPLQEKTETTDSSVQVEPSISVTFTSMDAPKLTDAFTQIKPLKVEHGEKFIQVGADSTEAGTAMPVINYVDNSSQMNILTLSRQVQVQTLRADVSTGKELLTNEMATEPHTTAKQDASVQVSNEVETEPAIIKAVVQGEQFAMPTLPTPADVTDSSAQTMLKTAEFCNQFQPETLDKFTEKRVDGINFALQVSQNSTDSSTETMQVVNKTIPVRPHTQDKATECAESTPDAVDVSIQYTIDNSDIGISAEPQTMEDGTMMEIKVQHDVGTQAQCEITVEPAIIQEVMRAPEESVTSMTWDVPTSDADTQTVPEETKQKGTSTQGIKMTDERSIADGSIQVNPDVTSVGTLAVTTDHITHATQVKPQTTDRGMTTVIRGSERSNMTNLLPKAYRKPSKDASVQIQPVLNLRSQGTLTNKTDVKAMPVQVSPATSTHGQTTRPDVREQWSMTDKAPDVFELIIPQREKPVEAAMPILKVELLDKTTQVITPGRKDTFSETEISQTEVATQYYSTCDEMATQTSRPDIIEQWRMTDEAPEKDVFEFIIPQKEKPVEAAMPILKVELLDKTTQVITPGRKDTFSETEISQTEVATQYYSTCDEMATQTTRPDIIEQWSMTDEAPEKDVFEFITPQKEKPVEAAVPILKELIDKTTQVITPGRKDTFTATEISQTQAATQYDSTCDEMATQTDAETQPELTSISTQMEVHVIDTAAQTLSVQMESVGLSTDVPQYKASFAQYEPNQFRSSVSNQTTVPTRSTGFSPQKNVFKSTGISPEKIDVKTSSTQYQTAATQNTSMQTEEQEVPTGLQDVISTEEFQTLAAIPRFPVMELVDAETQAESVVIRQAEVSSQTESEVLPSINDMGSQYEAYTKHSDVQTIQVKVESKSMSTIGPQLKESYVQYEPERFRMAVSSQTTVPTQTTGFTTEKATLKTTGVSPDKVEVKASSTQYQVATTQDNDMQTDEQEEPLQFEEFITVEEVPTVEYMPELPPELVDAETQAESVVIRQAEVSSQTKSEVLPSINDMGSQYEAYTKHSDVQTIQVKVESKSMSTIGPQLKESYVQYEPERFRMAVSSQTTVPTQTTGFTTEKATLKTTGVSPDKVEVKASSTQYQVATTQDNDMQTDEQEEPLQFEEFITVEEVPTVEYMPELPPELVDAETQAESVVIRQAEVSSQTKSEVLPSINDMGSQYEAYTKHSDVQTIQVKVESKSMSTIGPQLKESYVQYEPERFRMAVSSQTTVPTQTKGFTTEKATLKTTGVSPDKVEVKASSTQYQVATTQDNDMQTDEQEEPLQFEEFITVEEVPTVEYMPELPPELVDAETQAESVVIRQADVSSQTKSEVLPSINDMGSQYEAYTKHSDVQTIQVKVESKSMSTIGPQLKESYVQYEPEHFRMAVSSQTTVPTQTTGFTTEKATLKTTGVSPDKVEVKASSTQYQIATTQDNGMQTDEQEEPLQFEEFITVEEVPTVEYMPELPPELVDAETQAEPMTTDRAILTRPERQEKATSTAVKKFSQAVVQNVPRMTSFSQQMTTQRPAAHSQGTTMVKIEFSSKPTQVEPSTRTFGQMMEPKVTDHCSMTDEEPVEEMIAPKEEIVVQSLPPIFHIETQDADVQVEPSTSSIAIDTHPETADQASLIHPETREVPSQMSIKHATAAAQATVRLSSISSQTLKPEKIPVKSFGVQTQRYMMTSSSYVQLKEKTYKPVDHMGDLVGIKARESPMKTENKQLQATATMVNTTSQSVGPHQTTAGFQTEEMVEVADMEVQTNPVTIIDFVPVLVDSAVQYQPMYFYSASTQVDLPTTHQHVSAVVSNRTQETAMPVIKVQPSSSQTESHQGKDNYSQTDPIPEPEPFIMPMKIEPVLFAPQPLPPQTQVAESQTDTVTSTDQSTSVRLPKLLNSQVQVRPQMQDTNTMTPVKQYFPKGVQEEPSMQSKILQAYPDVKEGSTWTEINPAMESSSQTDPQSEPFITPITLEPVQYAAPTVLPEMLVAGSQTDDIHSFDQSTSMQFPKLHSSHVQVSLQMHDINTMTPLKHYAPKTMQANPDVKEGSTWTEINPTMDSTSQTDPIPEPEPIIAPITLEPVQFAAPTVLPEMLTAESQTDGAYSVDHGTSMQFPKFHSSHVQVSLQMHDINTMTTLKHYVPKAVQEEPSMQSRTMQAYPDVREGSTWMEINPTMDSNSQTDPVPEPEPLLAHITLEPVQFAAPTVLPEMLTAESQTDGIHSVDHGTSMQFPKLHSSHVQASLRMHDINTMTPVKHYATKTMQAYTDVKEGSTWTEINPTMDSASQTDPVPEPEPLLAPITLEPVQFAAPAVLPEMLTAESQTDDIHSVDQCTSMQFPKLHSSHVQVTMEKPNISDQASQHDTDTMHISLQVAPESNDASTSIEPIVQELIEAQTQHSVDSTNFETQTSTQTKDQASFIDIEMQESVCQTELTLEDLEDMLATLKQKLEAEPMIQELIIPQQLNPVHAPMTLQVCTDDLGIQTFLETVERSTSPILQEVKHAITQYELELKELGLQVKPDVLDKEMETFMVNVQDAAIQYASLYGEDKPTQVSPEVQERGSLTHQKTYQHNYTNTKAISLASKTMQVSPDNIDKVTAPISRWTQRETIWADAPMQVRPVLEDAVSQTDTILKEDIQAMLKPIERKDVRLEIKSYKETNTVEIQTDPVIIKSAGPDDENESWLDSGIDTDVQTDPVVILSELESEIEVMDEDCQTYQVDMIDADIQVERKENVKDTTSQTTFQPQTTKTEPKQVFYIGTVTTAPMVKPISSQTIPTETETKGFQFEPVPYLTNEDIDTQTPTTSTKEQGTHALDSRVQSLTTQTDELPVIEPEIIHVASLQPVESQMTFSAPEVEVTDAGVQASTVVTDENSQTTRIHTTDRPSSPGICYSVAESQTISPVCRTTDTQYEPHALPKKTQTDTTVTVNMGIVTDQVISQDICLQTFLETKPEIVDRSIQHATLVFTGFSQTEETECQDDETQTDEIEEEIQYRYIDPSPEALDAFSQTTDERVNMEAQTDGPDIVQSGTDAPVTHLTTVGLQVRPVTKLQAGATQTPRSSTRNEGTVMEPTESVSMSVQTDIIPVHVVDEQISPVYVQPVHAPLTLPEFKPEIQDISVQTDVNTDDRGMQHDSENAQFNIFSTRVVKGEVTPTVISEYSVKPQKKQFISHLEAMAYPKEEKLTNKHFVNVPTQVQPEVNDAPVQVQPAQDDHATATDEPLYHSIEVQTESLDEPMEEIIRVSQVPVQHSPYLDLGPILLDIGTQVEPNTREHGISAVMPLDEPSYLELGPMLLDTGTQVKPKTYEHGMSTVMPLDEPSYLELGPMLLDTGTQVKPKTYEHGMSTVMPLDEPSYLELGPMLLDTGTQAEPKTREHGMSTIMPLDDPSYLELGPMLLDTGTQAEPKKREHGMSSVMPLDEPSYLELGSILLDTGTQVQPKTREHGMSTIMPQATIGKKDAGVQAKTEKDVSVMTAGIQTVVIYDEKPLMMDVGMQFRPLYTDQATLTSKTRTASSFSNTEPVNMKQAIVQVAIKPQTEARATLTVPKYSRNITTQAETTSYDACVQHDNLPDLADKGLQIMPVMVDGTSETVQSRRVDRPTQVDIDGMKPLTCDASMQHAQEKDISDKISQIKPISTEAGVSTEVETKDKGIQAEFIPEVDEFIRPDVTEIQHAPVYFPEIATTDSSVQHQPSYDTQTMQTSIDVRERASSPVGPDYCDGSCQTKTDTSDVGVQTCFQETSTAEVQAVMSYYSEDSFQLESVQEDLISLQRTTEEQQMAPLPTVLYQDAHTQYNLATEDSTTETVSTGIDFSNQSKPLTIEQGTTTDITKHSQVEVQVDMGNHSVITHDTAVQHERMYKPVDAVTQVYPLTVEEGTSTVPVKRIEASVQYIAPTDKRPSSPKIVPDTTEKGTSPEYVTAQSATQTVLYKSDVGIQSRPNTKSKLTHVAIKLDCKDQSTDTSPNVRAFETQTFFPQKNAGSQCDQATLVHNTSQYERLFVEDNSVQVKPVIREQGNSPVFKRKEVGNASSQTELVQEELDSSVEDLIRSAPTRPFRPAAESDFMHDYSDRLKEYLDRDEHVTEFVEFPTESIKTSSQFKPRQESSSPVWDYAGDFSSCLYDTEMTESVDIIQRLLISDQGPFDLEEPIGKDETDWVMSEPKYVIDSAVQTGIMHTKDRSTSPLFPPTQEAQCQIDTEIGHSDTNVQASPVTSSESTCTALVSSHDVSSQADFAIENILTSDAGTQHYVLGQDISAQVEPLMIDAGMTYKVDSTPTSTQAKPQTSEQGTVTLKELKPTSDTQTQAKPDVVTKTTSPLFIRKNQMAVQVQVAQRHTQTQYDRVGSVDGVVQTSPESHEKGTSTKPDNRDISIQVNPTQRHETTQYEKSIKTVDFMVQYRAQHLDISTQSVDVQTVCQDRASSPIHMPPSEIQKHTSLITESPIQPAVVQQVSAAPTNLQPVERVDDTQLRREIRDEIRMEVINDIREEVREELFHEVQHVMNSQIEEDVREGLRTELEITVREELREECIEEYKEEILIEIKEELKIEFESRIRLEFEERTRDDLEFQIRREIEPRVRRDLEPIIRREIEQEYVKETIHEVVAEAPVMYQPTEYKPEPIKPLMLDRGTSPAVTNLHDARVQVGTESKDKSSQYDMPRKPVDGVTQTHVYTVDCGTTPDKARTLNALVQAQPRMIHQGTTPRETPNRESGVQAVVLKTDKCDQHEARPSQSDVAIQFSREPQTVGVTCQVQPDTEEQGTSMEATKVQQIYVQTENPLRRSENTQTITDQTDAICQSEPVFVRDTTLQVQPVTFDKSTSTLPQQSGELATQVEFISTDMHAEKIPVEQQDSSVQHEQSAEVTDRRIQARPVVREQANSPLSFLPFDMISPRSQDPAHVSPHQAVVQKTDKCDQHEARPSQSDVAIQFSREPQTVGVTCQVQPDTEEQGTSMEATKVQQIYVQTENPLRRSENTQTITDQTDAICQSEPVFVRDTTLQVQPVTFDKSTSTLPQQSGELATQVEFISTDMHAEKIPVEQQDSSVQHEQSAEVTDRRIQARPVVREQANSPLSFLPFDMISPRSQDPAHVSPYQAVVQKTDKCDKHEARPSQSDVAIQFSREPQTVGVTCQVQPDTEEKGTSMEATKVQQIYVQTENPLRRSENTQTITDQTDAICQSEPVFVRDTTLQVQPVTFDKSTSTLPQQSGELATQVEFISTDMHAEKITVEQQDSSVQHEQSAEVTDRRIQARPVVREQANSPLSFLPYDIISPQSQDPAHVSPYSFQPRSAPKERPYVAEIITGERIVPVEHTAPSFPSPKTSDPSSFKYTYDFPDWKAKSPALEPQVARLDYVPFKTDLDTYRPPTVSQSLYRNSYESKYESSKVFTQDIVQSMPPRCEMILLQTTTAGTTYTSAFRTSTPATYAPYPSTSYPSRTSILEPGKPSEVSPEITSPIFSDTDSDSLPEMTELERIRRDLRLSKVIVTDDQATLVGYLVNRHDVSRTPDLPDTSPFSTPFSSPDYTRSIFSNTPHNPRKGCQHFMNLEHKPTEIIPDVTMEDAIEDFPGVMEHGDWFKRETSAYRLNVPYDKKGSPLSGARIVHFMSPSPSPSHTPGRMSPVYLSPEHENSTELLPIPRGMVTRLSDLLSGGLSSDDESVLPMSRLSEMIEKHRELSQPPKRSPHNDFPTSISKEPESEVDTTDSETDTESFTAVMDFTDPFLHEDPNFWRGGQTDFCTSSTNSDVSSDDDTVTVYGDCDVYSFDLPTLKPFKPSRSSRDASFVPGEPPRRRRSVIKIDRHRIREELSMSEVVQPEGPPRLTGYRMNMDDSVWQRERHNNRLSRSEPDLYRATTANVPMTSVTSPPSYSSAYPYTSLGHGRRHPAPEQLMVDAGSIPALSTEIRYAKLVEKQDISHSQWSQYGRLSQSDPDLASWHEELFDVGKF